MRVRIVYWIILPLLLLVVSLAVHLIATRCRGSRDPIIEVPLSVDLGERERGEIAVGRFSIFNRGGKELIIDQIRTSCACSGLERETNGQFARIDSLRLSAGDQ